MREPITVNYNEKGIPDSVPTYLFDYAETYRRNPHDAALEWFTAAHYGLSVFFGLHALLGRHEDILGRGEIPPAQYSLLPSHFKCENFDAVDIVELAVAAGARYLLFPACYDDGFCLFGTAESDYNSVASAAKRDFVAELASCCEYQGIGLALEYTFGVNHRRHPDGVPATAEAHEEYQEHVKAQLHELLTNYGPIAAICFGGLKRIREQQPSFDLQDCYDYIISLQPNTLVSFRHGYNGAEDFFSVAERLPSIDAPAEEQGFLYLNRKRPVEIRTSLMPGGRGYNAEMAGRHMRAPQLWEAMRGANRAHANLLVNTALMPDGSLDLEDINTLLEAGQRMEKEGRPQ